MTRKIPSLGSVLMMITALIVTIPAHADLQLFFVHNDHLGTPKYLTDATGKAVWQAQATPFGEVIEKEDLDGDGKYVTLNMRFPGQYWDHETGTSYNYFRDYDPSLGRYLQSDPIGLGGGMNTYAYVGGNPLSFWDMYGLAACGWGDTTVTCACKTATRNAQQSCQQAGGVPLFPNLLYENASDTSKDETNDCPTTPPPPPPPMDCADAIFECQDELGVGFWGNRSAKEYEKLLHDCLKKKAPHCV